MKLLENIKAKAVIGATSLMMLPMQVFADESTTDKNGGFKDTVNTLNESGIIDRLSRPISMALNIGFLVFGIVLGIGALMDFLKSGNQDNPNQEKELKKSATKKAIFAAISILGVTILNLIFSILGIPWGFNA